MDAFIEERKAVNVQANQKIDTMESSLDKRIDGLQSEIDRLDTDASSHGQSQQKSVDRWR